MSRRSTPQSRIDDQAFPVRIKVRVPGDGFGAALAQMHDWLDREVGRGNYAHHPTQGFVMEAVAFYFRHPAAAHRFVREFDLALADGTESIAYRSADGAEGNVRKVRIVAVSVQSARRKPDLIG